MDYCIEQNSYVLQSGTKLIHKHYDQLTSTQVIAKQQAKQIIPNQWYLWTANAQSNGLGQNNKAWLSPYGTNIYATYGFLIHHDELSTTQFIPYIAGLSVIQMLAMYNLTSKIKWVNDVLIDQKKIGGILSENLGKNPSTDLCTILIGIGINVNCKIDDLNGVNQPFTSMYIEMGLEYDLKQIILKLSNILESNINDLFVNKFASFHKTVERNLEKFDGIEIMFDTLNYNQERYLRGFIKGISAKGEILISVDGETKSFIHGQILP